MQKITSWALSIFVAFIFVQSTFFKFSGAEETRIIFGTLADWMGSIGLPSLVSEALRTFGAYGVGAVELAAAVLVLVPATRMVGAGLSHLVITGAILAHVATPLGIDRVVDQAGNTDGGALFFTAIALWVSSALILALGRFGKRTLSTPLAGAPGLEAA